MTGRLTLAFAHEPAIIDQLVIHYGATGIKVCRTRVALFSAMHRCAARCVVIEFGGLLDAAAGPMIRRVRDACPKIPIVGLCVSSPRAAEAIVDAANAGVDGVVLTGQGDIGAEIERVLARQRQEPMVAAALSCIPERRSRIAHQLLHCAMLHAEDGLNVGQLAQALGIPRRTLVRHFAVVGLPTPHDVVAWARVLVASELLENTNRQLSLVAKEIGCPSAVSLRKLIRRYLGIPPSELRQPGSTSRALASFRASVQGTPVTRGDSKT